MTYRLNEWVRHAADLAADPDVCTLPDDDFSSAEMSVALIQMGCYAVPGQFGYLALLGNNPTADVARDALSQLRPAHPGSAAAEEDGPEWQAYAAAKSAWDRLHRSFPAAWLLYA